MGVREYFLKDIMHPKGGIWIKCKNDKDCIFCDHCTDIYWDYTYSTYQNSNRLQLVNGVPSVVMFTGPVMLGMYIPAVGDFGTAAAPTFVKLSAVKMSANDWVARELASLSVSSTEVIPDNTDIDTITTPGQYRVVDSASAATMIHGPVTNAGYRLLVLATTANNRLMQIAFCNVDGDNPDRIYIRPNYGSYGVWQALAPKSYVDAEIPKASNKAITASGVTLTASNYLTYFPNGSFNDAPLNSIYGISVDVPLSDGPDGNDWIGYGTHTATGYNRGILVTFRQYTINDTKYSGITQMLIGYR